MSWPSSSPDSDGSSGDNSQYSPIPGNHNPNAELLQQARAQIERLRPSLDLSVPLLASFPWAVTSVHILNRTAASVAAARSQISRDLSDREVSALVRVSRAHTAAYAEGQWLSLLLAGVLYMRGRKTNRFPFWTPKQGRVPGGGGPITQLMRMSAYSTVCVLAMGPVNSGYALMASMNEIKRNDADLKQMFDEVQKSRATRMQAHSQGGNPRQHASMRRAPVQDNSAQTWEGGNGQSQSFESQQQQQQPAYTARWPQDQSTQYTPESRPQRYQSPRPVAEPEQSDPWGSSPIIDDASPLAPSEPDSSQPANTTWARLRQQARSNKPQQPSANSSWNQVRQSGAAEESWDNANTMDDGASRGTRGQPRDSYTFSPQDAERATAKDQAQRDFDAMLERERRGEGGSGGGWSR
ncbi:hypothetical protein LIA77_09764 [Sarocladium implicatum]|nr:hypothetical protein LIA77_09764 [Sarocladium implicatum]